MYSVRYFGFLPFWASISFSDRCEKAIIFFPTVEMWRSVENNYYIKNI